MSDQGRSTTPDTCDHEDHVEDGHGGGHWMRCGYRLPCPDHPWMTAPASTTTPKSNI